MPLTEDGDQFLDLLVIERSANVTAKVVPSGAVTRLVGRRPVVLGLAPGGFAVTWDGGQRMEIPFERIARVRFGGAPRWGNRDAWFFTIRFKMMEGDSRVSASAHDRDGLALRALMRESVEILLRDHPSVRVETGATWLAASVPAVAAALVTLALSALSVGFLGDGTVAAGVIMACGAIAAGFYSRFFFRLLPRRVSDAATVAEHLRLSGEPRDAG